MSEAGLLAELFPLDHDYPLSLHEITFQSLASSSAVSTTVSTQCIPVQTMCEGTGNLDHPRQRLVGQRGNELRYNWYHAPHNNLDWLHSMMTKMLSASDYNRFSRTMLDREELIRHVSLITKSIRPGCESISREGTTSALPHATARSSLEGNPRRHNGFPIVTLMLPFLGWDDVSHLGKRRKALEMLVSGNVRPEIQKVYASVMSHPQYRYRSASVVASKPLQLPSTLDQYQFPSIATSSGFARTSNRIENQAVPRRTKVSLAHQKALVVNHLWLVSINNDTVVTFSSGGEKPFLGDKTNYPLEEKIKARLLEIVSPMEACSDVHSLCTLIIQTAVNLITETSQSRGFDLIECYKNIISELREEFMQALATFRDEALRPNPDLNSSIKVEGTWTSIFDVSNLLDEISVLQEVYNTQLNVLDMFGTTIWGENWKDQRFGESAYVPGLTRLFETKGTIHDFLSSFKSLQASLLQNKTDWLNLLDLYEKRASLQEARLAVKQAEQAARQTEVSHALAESAAKQTRVLMVFTFMTVVFLPLSFFTSFFSMSVREFSTDPNEPTTLAKFWALAGPISAVIWFIALGIAFPSQSIRFTRSLLGAMRN